MPLCPRATRLPQRDPSACRRHDPTQPKGPSTGDVRHILLARHAPDSPQWRLIAPIRLLRELPKLPHRLKIPLIAWHNPIPPLGQNKNGQIILQDLSTKKMIVVLALNQSVLPQLAEPAICDRGMSTRLR